MVWCWWWLAVWCWWWPAVWWWWWPDKRLLPEIMAGFSLCFKILIFYWFPNLFVYFVSKSNLWICCVWVYIWIWYMFPRSWFDSDFRCDFSFLILVLQNLKIVLLIIFKFVYSLDIDGLYGIDYKKKLSFLNLIGRNGIGKFF